jgi:superfamily I DNA and RNA helicase
MSTFVVWVSETGLIVTHRGGFLLEDPLAEPIQLWDSLLEAQMMAKHIETNPFKVGDKVRVKRYENEMYKEGAFDVVYHISHNGNMQLQFWEDDGVSDCVYTWDSLMPYSED